MKIVRIARVFLLPGLVVAAVLALEANGFAQCSMCRASLAGTNPLFIRNFNIAVLVLLTPPVAIFCSMFIVLKRHSAPKDDATDPEGPNS
jgi:hypothetical protein